MRYKIDVEFMHGDAAKYDSRTSIFNDEGDSSKIEVIKKYLIEAGKNRDACASNFTKDDELEEYMYDELCQGDCTADGSFYARVTYWSVKELKEKKKLKEPKLEVKTGMISIETLKEYFKYRLSVQKDPENDYITGYNDGIEKEFKLLNKKLK